MRKKIGPAYISGNDERPTLVLYGQTGRGQGTEYVAARIQLRDLLVGLCKDGELRLLVLESLLQAERETQQIERTEVDQAQSDRETIGAWIDLLDAEELQVVTHRYRLNNASLRYSWNKNAAYNRAIRKLPRGVGEETLSKILRRRNS